MTRKQAKLCKKILKYRTLDKIIYHCGMDEFELEECFKPGQLDFEDTDDGVTVISLCDDLQEEYEERQFLHYQVYLNRIISIIALLVSIVSLIVQILR